MVSILFVCLGNICRSPMAEAVFRHKVKEAGLSERIRIDSAGTGDWHVGHPPHEGTRRVLADKGIDAEGMRARKLGKSDFTEFHYMIGMDSKNVMHMLEICGSEPTSAEIRKLLDFDPTACVKDVPDPYYTGNFDEVFELIDRSCDLLLEVVRIREGF